MFEKLLKELNHYLMKFYIGLNTNIFEDVLLELAGITTHKSCQYGPINNANKMYFAVKGINQEQAIKFLNFFKINFNDNKACYNLNEELDAYCFEVDTEIVYKKIFPIFKNYVQTLKDNASERLQIYQDKSINTFSVKVQHLLDSLMVFEESVKANHFLSDLSFIVPCKGGVKSFKFLEIINNFKLSLSKHSMELKQLNVPACQLLNRTLSLILECDKNNKLVKDFQKKLNKFYDALPQVHSNSPHAMPLSTGSRNKSYMSSICKLGLFALSSAAVAYGIYQKIQMQNSNHFSCLDF